MSENNQEDNTPSCCESVNEERTLLIKAISQLDGLLNTQVSDYSGYLESLDQIKTLAFCVYAKILKRDCGDKECCEAAAKAIRIVTQRFINTISTNSEIQKENFRLYRQLIKLIFKAFKKGGPCCLGVSNGLSTFYELNVTSANQLIVQEDFNQAICILFKKGEGKCCEAAGPALANIALGFAFILDQLKDAFENGYLTALQLAEERELKAYRQLLCFILDAASDKCSRCCSDVVKGVASLIVQLSQVYFSESLPGNPTTTAGELYLHYLDLLRKIRKTAVCQYERILEKADNKKCCETVTENLADSTGYFVQALLEILIAQLIFLAPGQITLEDAIKNLDAFACEYPLLAEQIADGAVEKDDSSSSSCHSSKSSKSCKQSKHSKRSKYSEHSKHSLKCKKPSKHY